MCLSPLTQPCIGSLRVVQKAAGDPKLQDNLKRKGYNYMHYDRSAGAYVLSFNGELKYGAPGTYHIREQEQVTTI